MRGDRNSDTFFGNTYRLPSVRVDLRGRGRARKVRRAVSDGLRRRADAAQNYDQSTYVIEEAPVDSAAGRKPEKQFLYPRRRDPHEVDTYVGPPMMKQVDFQASKFRILSRMVLYLRAALEWYALNLWDKLRRRETPERRQERRAVRLRQIIERLGGTAIKIGQQMAMRTDMMPYVYGVELSKLFESVRAFKTDEAIKRIEAVTKKPLEESFAEFNEEPIGSASVACVYEAVLHTGERVAVKVRRPGIGERFVADCLALAWVFRTLEFFTLLREGLSHNFLFEFRTMLIEELDFIKEARHTELFRRRAHKRLRRVTAPKVFFDFSGEDVLVTEFMPGVPLGDIIAFVEQKDREALAQLRRLNIDPETVAKRLIRVNQFGVFENLLFHADPHPSNVRVQPNNTLVFIDFGSVGAYTTVERNNWRQLNYYHQREDVGRMAQTALAILEPLPAIDVDDFRRRLEQVFWQDLYAFKSKHSQWYEHTSARIWMSLLGLAREYKVPMNLNTLRMIRSTLLSETVAARIYPKIDAWREHRKYNKGAAKQARKRVLRGFWKRVCGGPTKSDYQRIEQLKGLFNRTVYLYQRFLDNPLYRYGLIIKKAVYAIALIIRTVLNFLMIAVGVLIVHISLQIYDQVIRGPKDIKGYMEQPFVTSSFKFLFFNTNWTTRVFWLLVLIGIFLNMRRMLMRFWDKDIRRRNTSGLS